MAEIKNISSSNRKISQNNQYRELLKSIDINSARNCTAEKKTYDSLQAEIGSLNAKTNAARDEITKMSKIGDCCPTCGQDVSPQFKDDHIAMHEKIVDQSIEARVLIAEEIETIKKENKQYEEAQKQIKEWETLFSKIDQTLPSTLLDEDELSSKLKVLQIKVREQQAEIETIEKQNQAASAHNAKIEVITEQTLEFEEQLRELLASIEEVRNKKANLEILKKAFSTNGLIAYKIENLVKELEELVNEYLGELSDGRFTLEFVVTNDKLNVEITDNGNIVDILALSSGELARVNTSTLIAIRRLMSSISSSQINVLFLDEVITVLDDVGREKLVEVLLAEEELNTYLVSHGWSHPLLEKIEIIKKDEISEIV